MCYATIAMGSLILAIVILSCMYMKEGFEYNQLPSTYDGQKLLELPPISPSWFKPGVDSHCVYCPEQSGMTIPPGALKYNGQPKLSESYGVGCTDERGWYY